MKPPLTRNQPLYEEVLKCGYVLPAHPPLGCRDEGQRWRKSLLCDQGAWWRDFLEPLGTGNRLLRKPRGWYLPRPREVQIGVCGIRSKDTLCWKWAAMQNQHKAQKVDSYPLARFNTWQIPEQPFPSVTLGALQELVRRVGSFLPSWACPVQTRGINCRDSCSLGGLPVPSAHSSSTTLQQSLQPILWWIQGGLGMGFWVLAGGCHTVRNASDAKKRASSRLNLSLCLYLHVRYPRREGRTCQCVSDHLEAEELRAKLKTKMWNACAQPDFSEYLYPCSWRDLILFPPGAFSPRSEGAEALVGGCPCEPCSLPQNYQNSDLTAPQGFCFPQVWYLLN